MTDTSPITVLATIVAAPGNEASVRDALVVLAAATRAEPDNIEYRVVAAANDVATFVTVERWRSQAAIDAHMRSPHLAAAFADVGTLLAAAPEIVSYTELTPA